MDIVPRVTCPQSSGTCRSHLGCPPGYAARGNELGFETEQLRRGTTSHHTSTSANSNGKRRRHPVAKVKGNWAPEEDARLVRCVLQSFCSWDQDASAATE